jgi:hypothetical protein
MSNYVYQKVYKYHYGEVPIDEQGRKYDIHHLDGNHKNNDPSNLKAVSIQEHYDIHYSQGDWAACHRISGRMNLSPEEISFLAKKRNEMLVKEGRHNWQGDGSIQRELNRKRIEDGTHNFLGGENIRKRYEEGNPPWGSPEEVSKRTQKQISEGKHPWQMKFPCPTCGRMMNKGSLSNHTPKCKGY